MRRKLAVLLSAAIFAAQVLVLPAIAEDNNDACLYTDAETPEDPVITATYLISYRSITVSNSNGRLYVRGVTESSVNADTIGIKDIVVERSSNGTSGWTQIAYPSDCLKTNTNKCEMEKWITVSHGYTWQKYKQNTANTASVPDTNYDPATYSITPSNTGLNAINGDSPRAIIGDDDMKPAYGSSHEISPVVLPEQSAGKL